MPFSSLDIVNLPSIPQKFAQVSIIYSEIELSNPIYG